MLLTTSIATSKTPYRITNLKPGDIFSHGYHKASILMADCHSILWGLFRRVAPE